MEWRAISPVRSPGFVILLVISLAMIAARPGIAQASRDREAKAATTRYPEFNALRTGWARNLHEKKLDALLAAYAPDADFVQPNGTHVRGTKNLATLFRSVMSTFDSDLVFTPESVAVVAAAATEDGRYTETLITRTTGEKQVIHGAYRTVYHRDAKARWLIEKQVWPAPDGK
jgi:ketosteroid isomerase-like protein